MPEALIWLRAYVGVYAATLTGCKQLILFIFRRDATTCQVHMRYVVAYVVPDVMVSRALAQRVDQRMGCGCCVSFRQLRTCRGTLPGQQRASKRPFTALAGSNVSSILGCRRDVPKFRQRASRVRRASNSLATTI
jgi:hypothetical protein